ncbi:MAG: response regulator [Candidatus Eremiobacterota bacterium]
MKKGRILIVEDNLIVGESLQQTLEDYEYNVPGIVISGEEALKETEEVKPDLILMDIKLKGEMDGITAAEKIYSDFDIPVIYLTAYSSNSLLDRIKLTGSYGYILKPFKEKELIFNIEMALYKHRMEKALKESEERLNMALSGTGLWDWNIETGMIYFSRMYHTMLGYEPDEIPPSYDIWKSLIHPQEIEKFEDSINDILENKKEFYEIEYRMKTKAGEWKWILSRGKVGERNDKNTPVRIIGTHTDITEKKKSEEENKKIEERIRSIQKHESLGKMAGGIAHGFNNILASILGYAEISIMESPPDSPIRYYLQKIQKATHRGSDITKQMLSYTGHGKVTMEEIDLSSLIEEMHQFIEISTSNRCNITYAIDENLPVIQGDAGQIRQVIMNLLMNASEAIENNSGTVTLKTGKISCDEAYLCKNYPEEHLLPGTYLYLDVSDTGCGIPEEIQSKIFDPFFTTKFLGRGLGLAAVHGIVRVHRGAIKVLSRKGEGTTMRLLFPALRYLQGKEKEKDLSVPEVYTGGKTVLVIDDSEDICTVAGKLLGKAGFTVMTASNGLEGLEIFRARCEDISLIILDVAMPVMSGDKVFKELKLIKKEVPVIITSGYNEAHAMSRFGKTEIAGFIQKPYRGQDLIEMAKSLAKKK